MATFTPNPNLSKTSNKKDWAYHLGCLPLNDHIVFTKQDLLAFLKTKGVEVGPNFVEINRLPQYATVGTFSSDPSGDSSANDASSLDSVTAPASSAAAAPVAASGSTNFNAATVPVRDASGDVFRPTRRVREAIGGGSNAVASSLMGYDGEDQIAPVATARKGAQARAVEATRSSWASPEKENIPAGSPKRAGDAKAPTQADLEQDQKEHALNQTFRPTRRVREPGGTGGASSIVLG